MVWKSLLILAAALALIYLGRLTVMVGVLAIIVKTLIVALAVVLIGGASMYLWKRHRASQVKQLAIRQ